MAKCDRVKTKCEGFCPCPKLCKCRNMWKPVCGKNGKTYRNSCMANCNGVKTLCNGRCPCPKQCPCPRILKPVCGKDGKTYGNSCMAKCEGVETQCDGKCPCTIDSDEYEDAYDLTEENDKDSLEEYDLFDILTHYGNFLK